MWPGRRHFGQNERVIGRVAEDGHGGEVLGRCPQQGHAADVYLLHRFGQAHLGPGHGLGEGVEVDCHQVKGGDGVGSQFGQVGRLPTGQDAAVDGRMQGLDPPVQDLGETGDLFHRAHGQACLAQHVGRAAGGDELHAPIGQPAGEFHQAGLVGNAQ